MVGKRVKNHASNGIQRAGCSPIVLLQLWLPIVPGNAVRQRWDFPLPYLHSFRNKLIDSNANFVRQCLRKQHLAGTHGASITTREYFGYLQAVNVRCTLHKKLYGIGIHRNEIVVWQIPDEQQTQKGCSENRCREKRLLAKLKSLI